MKIIGRFRAGKLSMIGLFSIMIFANMQVASAAGAREYETPPCYDITGSSQPVLVGGQNNGGVMNFDDAGVGAAYQGCVRMKADRVTPDHLEGWVWDTNLGWVSLYCPASGINLDLACGGQQYSVTFTASGGTAPDFTTVSIDGYAWGDNIGWISFKDVISGSTWNWMKPLPSGASRGLVSPVSAGSDKFVYANSIGWLDFSSVWFHWEDTDPPITDPNVLKYISVCSSKDITGTSAYGSKTCSCDLDGTCTMISDSTKAPNADGGTDKYYIEIPFYDGAANIPSTNIDECSSTSLSMYTLKPGVNAYCGKIVLTWEDDVDFDQTTAASQKQATPQFNVTNLGAVTKPLSPFTLTGGSFTYDAVSKLWRATAVSLAPTSDKNKSGSFSNEKFYYYNYADANPDDVSVYNPDKIDQNLLKLKEIKLMLFKYSTSVGVPGSCMYGTINGSNCDLRNYQIASGTTLGFNPMVTGDKMVYKKKVGSTVTDINYIDVTNADAQQNLEYQFTQKGSVSPTVVLTAGLMDEASYLLRFVNSFPTAWADRNDGTKVYATKSATLGSIQSLIAQVLYDKSGGSFSSATNPYLYSKVSYLLGGKTIKFWSNKLPRIKAGVLINPVAKVQGNVYLTDYEAKTSNNALKSLGNIASNLKREQILRNVERYKRGKTLNYSSYATAIDSLDVASLDTKFTYKLYEDANKVVYMINGGGWPPMQVIDCSGPCTFKKNITIILSGGNFVINSDIQPDPSTPNVQIGLIALQTLDDKVGGYLYLDNDVGLLKNVNLYLDRVIVSRDGDLPTPGSKIYYDNFSSEDAGYPYPPIGKEDDYSRQQMFNNQLVFVGTLSSRNGIGNASRTIPVDEYGLETPGTSCTYSPATISGICRAKLVDLNNLRYYGPGLESCSSSGVAVDQALKAAGDVDGGCNPDTVGYDIDATCLYDAATASSCDLISGGGTGKQSSYFVGKTPSLENEYPVNFFYKPISKDLAGFEVEQEFNPLIQ